MWFRVWKSKKKERENFGLLHCLVLLLSIAVIGGDSSITMSTAAFFFFFFAVVGNKLVLFGVDGKPCDMETALEKTEMVVVVVMVMVLFPLISYEMFCLFVHILWLLIKWRLNIIAIQNISDNNTEIHSFFYIDGASYLLQLID